MDEVLEAIENQITFPDGAVFVPALRRWVLRTSEEIKAEAEKPHRRRIAERFELADIPVVDSAQGEIWRFDIHRFIVIAGAPGTGKTTTAIKRIAQKIDSAALIDSNEVTAIPADTLRQWLEGPKNWALFTPSDLLRSYLQQALGQEGLAATEDRVPVWATTKIRIARDVLRVIGQGRFFSLDGDIVATRDSRSLAAWTLGFRNHFWKRMHDELKRAISEQAVLLEDTIRQLNQMPADKITDAQKAMADVWTEFPSLVSMPDGTPFPRILSSVLAVRGKLHRFGERHKEETWPDTERAHMKTVMAAANDIVGKFTDEANTSLDAVLRKLPITYQEYRLRASEGGRFYHSDAIGAVNDRRLDPLELDTLIYVALLTVRGAFACDEFAHQPGGGITQRLVNEFRYVVAVDEATDFSAVELACMRLLAHPIFDCATFSGDPMQRMTGHGIGDWPEIGELVEAPESHELRFSYRQSKKLLRIAACLFEKSVGRPAPFEAGFAESPDDPDALHHQEPSREAVAEWLIMRIGEIYQICGQLLPSIAVLVPSEDQVRALAGLIRQRLLSDYGIETEACLEGRILGTQAKVRVFSVQFIKGLEFEAVFFVNADKMAATTPSLVDRFLYVGLTRARSFLGVTTANGFPEELAHVSGFFAKDSWSACY
ncbi:MAG TPA: ATP-binding domain-containing protein [Verrucomicrobiota bacterium]|nr:ATP-binding domain-containing protein [Verrucomicrobiota bacterium]